MTDTLAIPGADAAPLRLEIRGMNCGHCVAAVERALRGVPGATVQDVAIGAASVTLGPGTTPADAVAAVRDAGYDARPVEGTPRAGGGACCSPRA